jgi:diadenosine tetraphosphate (Ap4A) HIT family hydrolase
MVRMAGDYIERVPCILCDQPAGDLVFEDEHTRVVVHEDWSPRGHVMVIARRHVENVSDLTIDEWLHVAQVWHRVERALLDLTKRDRSIVMKLGIQTPHLHIHLYPVSAGASRREVFAAIDGKTKEPRDERFVATLQSLIQNR